MKKFIAILLVAIMAMSLCAINTSATDKTVDENGNYIAASVTNFGFSSFGDLNKPENILDGDESTCTGSNFSEGTEQGIYFNLKKIGYVDRIFIQCKEEGTTTHEDGTTRGTYSIYAVNGEKTELIAENVPAITGTNGGYTVKLDKAVKAESIKVVITSWQGNCWACVADMTVHHAEGTELIDVIVDENGNYIPESVTNFGFSDFGNINKPENILDGDEKTCTGSGFNEDAEQGIYFNLKKAGYVDTIFIQCKEEGTTTHEDGTTRGTYSIYAVNGEKTELIAENVPAITGTNGGYTVKLGKAVKAESIKVVITSWQGDCWACIADMTVHQGEEPVNTGDATVMIAVVAVVALFGTAVIVKKVHD